MRSGLRLGQRLGESLDAGEVGAVGAGAGDKFGMAVDNEGRTLVLHGRSERLGAVDQATLTAVLEAKQHRGYVACGKRHGEGRGECRRVLDRGRYEVEARFGTRSGCSLSHGPRMVAQSGGKVTCRGQAGIGTGPMSFGTL